MHCSCTVRKKQAPFSTVIGNVELMQEGFLKHSNMRTARMKYDRKQNKKVRSKAGMKEKEVLTAYHYQIKIQ